VRDDVPLWSGKFDRKLSDVFAIQEEISHQIVNNLRLKLGRGRRRYETSIEAYDLFLQARANSIHHGMPGLEKTIHLFQEAIARDSSFAPAYAGLAAAYASLSGRNASDIDREDWLAGMKTAAQKAMELDPMIAEVHDALGTTYAREGNWELAENSFRRAIELDRRNALSYTHLVLFLLMPLGRIPEAVDQAIIAESNDPLSPEVHITLAYALISAGRYHEAAEHCLEMPASHEQHDEYLGRVRIGQGKLDEAIRILQSARNPGYLGYAYAKAGRREEATKMAQALADRSFQAALIFAGLGDRDRALDALEAMAETGPVRIGRDLTYPEFALLRGLPRLKAFRSRLGLPE
jgi:tetratricopeptide (TPR) repeat protein